MSTSLFKLFFLIKNMKYKIKFVYLHLMQDSTKISISKGLDSQKNHPIWDDFFVSQVLWQQHFSHHIILGEYG